MNKKNSNKNRITNIFISNKIPWWKIRKQESVKLFSLPKIKIKSIYDKAGIVAALVFKAAVIFLLDMSVRRPIRTNYFNPGIAGFLRAV